MPLKPHPTDPDKMVYASRCYDIPQLQGVTTTQPEQEPWRESASDYERGFIDGMQKQAQSSVDKAVNRMAQRPWAGLTDEERVSFDATNPKTQKEWDELFDGIEDNTQGEKHMIEEVMLEEYASPESGIHTKTSKKKIEFLSESQL